MYAIVRIGGKQYWAEPGKAIVVEKLPFEPGEAITLEDVLLVSNDGQVSIGQPYVSGAAVQAEVLRQFKGKKVIVFKYKRKNRYRRKNGHRQQYTQLKIKAVTV